MSVNGIVGSNSVAESGFMPSGLPRLSKDQRFAMIMQIAQSEQVAADKMPAISSRPIYEPEPGTTKISTANGIHVSVTQHPWQSMDDNRYTLQLGEEGSEISVDFSDSLRIGKTEDGLYAVYFSDDNVTRTYAPDGSFTETAGDRTDADAGRLFISTTRGETLQGGNGNDTFYLYGSDTTLDTGAGDNTVVVKRGVTSLQGGSCSSLTTGDGNNTISAALFSGTMTVGNGDNSISIGHLSGGMALGHGRNHVVVDTMAHAIIEPGNGDSTFTIGNMGIMSHISSRGATEARRTFNIGAMVGRSFIGLGGGSNTYNIGRMEGAPSISQYSGSMDATIDSMSGSASVGSNAGRASVYVRSMTNHAEVSVCGNSSVRVGEMSGSSNVLIYNWTAGDPSLVWDPKTGMLLSEKTGSSEVFIGKMRDSAKLAITGPNHLAAIGAMLDEAVLDLNRKENPISNVFIGTAEGTVKLPRESRYAQVLAELGPEGLEAVKATLAEWSRKREEGGLPAARQDLWASLHGETGKEEELMERMALLMSWN